MRLTVVLATFVLFVCSRAASPLQGDWQMNGGGALLRFAPAAGSQADLDIVWLDGPALDIPEGTVIGSAVASPEAGVYDCRVDFDPRGRGDRRKYVRFVIRIDKKTSDSFTITPYEQKTRVSLHALLPYWWRRPLRTVDTRPGGLDGARRVGAPKQFVEL